MSESTITALAEEQDSKFSHSSAGQSTDPPNKAQQNLGQQIMSHGHEARNQKTRVWNHSRSKNKVCKTRKPYGEAKAPNPAAVIIQ